MKEAMLNTVVIMRKYRPMIEEAIEQLKTIPDSFEDDVTKPSLSKEEEFIY